MLWQITLLPESVCLRNCVAVLVLSELVIGPFTSDKYGVLDGFYEDDSLKNCASY